MEPSPAREYSLFEEDVLGKNFKITSRLDCLPFKKWHYFVVACLGVTWVFDGYEVSMLSLTSLELMSYFNVEESWIGYLSSTYLAGCCCGAVLFGVLSSIFGRKRLFAITLLIYLASVITICFMTEYYGFLVCRFFTGIGVGGEYTAIFAAVDELIPPSVRGRTGIILDGTWHFGSFLAAIASLIVYKGFNAHETGLWRVLFFIGGVSAIPFIYLRRKIPESPRWLIIRGRVGEAENIVARIEKCIEDNVISADMNSSELNGTSDNSQANIATTQPGVKVTLNLIFYILFKKYPRRLFLGVVMMATQAFFYQGIFYTYTLILQNFYTVAKEDGGFYMMPLAVGSFIGPVFIGKYFDLIGRRKMIFLTYVGSGLLLILTALLFQYDILTIYWQLFLWFLVFFIASPGASSAHLTISEIFPCEIRSQAMAIFFFIGMGVGGVGAPSLFAVMVEAHSRIAMTGVYLLSSFLMIFGGIIGLKFGVNAENKSLESIT